MRDLIRKSFNFAVEHQAQIRTVCALCLLFVLTVVPEFSFAEKDFADMGGNVAEQSKGLASAAQMGFYLIGFAFVGIGLIMLATSHTGKGKGIVVMSIGFVLTSIGFFVSTGSTSFFGSDVSKTEELFE